MSHLTISEVGRRVGLRPSAIQYYEKLGILPPALRRSGQRRYDETALYRLAVVQRARQIGFTLDEIRELFFGFRDGTKPDRRWAEMSGRKLAELDALIEVIRTMQSILRTRSCRCATLDECGRRLLGKMCGEAPARPLPPDMRRRRREKHP
jgi:MerR family transcriptional regulator, redox-sensitive transcriptional activator SoxR